MLVTENGYHNMTSQVQILNSGVFHFALMPLGKNINLFSFQLWLNNKTDTGFVSFGQAFGQEGGKTLNSKSNILHLKKKN